MDLGIKGKKAIILGGTRGIGRSIAEVLLDEGCDVGICARTPDQVEVAVKELSSRGKAIGAPIDIADGEALKAWIDQSAKDLGGIDILVSNATGAALGARAKDWQANLNIDVMGAVNAFEAALPYLEEAGQENGDASFVAIGSVGHVNARSPSAYGAMKAALIHYIKGVAKEYAPKKIRANVVSPGTIYFKGGAWGLVEESNPAYFKDRIAANPLGRMGKPEEIADATAFLSSPRSAFTTGISMVVDGGLTDAVNF